MAITYGLSGKPHGQSSLTWLMSPYRVAKSLETTSNWARTVLSMVFYLPAFPSPVCQMRLLLRFKKYPHGEGAPEPSKIHIFKKQRMEKKLYVTHSTCQEKNLSLDALLGFPCHLIAQVWSQMPTPEPCLTEGKRMIMTG